MGTRGTHDQQPSMANLGIDRDGGRRCRFWNLAPPSRLSCDWLSLGCDFSVAWTAIHGLVPRSGQSSVGCHATLNFNMATVPVVNRMPPRCRSLRCRNLSMALVARAMASRSCFCSLRITRIGSGNDQGDSIPLEGRWRNPQLLISSANPETGTSASHWFSDGRGCEYLPGVVDLVG